MKRFVEKYNALPGPALAVTLLAMACGWALYLGAIQHATVQTFLPHGFCFLWDTRLLALHVVSDSVIFASYLSISVTLGILAWRRRGDLPLGWLVVSFGLFIIACGFTHLLDVVVLWKPLYWLAGDIKLLTAVASLTTAVMLPFLVPKIGRLLEEALVSRANDLRFHAALDSSMDAFYILESVRDEQGEIVDFTFQFVNERGAALISSTRDALRGKLLCENYPVNITEGHFERYKQVVETGERIEAEFAIDADKINAAWLHHRVVRLGDGVAITTADISQRKLDEQKLAQVATFTASIIASSPYATIVTDLRGRVTAMNPAAERLTGYKKEELLNRLSPLVLLDTADLARRAMSLTISHGSVVEPGMDVLLAKPSRGEVEDAEWRVIRKDGSRFDAQITVSGLSDHAGALTGLILIAYDITERKRTEEYIVHLAHHDALTGLPTRMLFHDRLNQAMLRARRNGHKVGVLLVDLDYFKKVNDRFGHHVGDQYLVEVGRRMKSALRESDTVARMGGDEFLLVLDNLHNQHDGERLVEKLLHLVSQPLHLGGITIDPRASMGLCMFPDSGDTAEQLIKNADAAMYQAKENGRNTFNCFNEELASASQRRILLEEGLQNAIRHNELELVYQPQISLETGRVHGVEALLRWNNDRLGNVSPMEFIPIAEETRLIGPIGEWVLRTACRQGRKLQEQAGRPLTIAVNVSPNQFHHGKLPELIREVLDETGLDPSTLELEITENILLTDTSKPLSSLEEIRAMGVRIAIDDFGTGFSSMAYIMRFRIDRLKIDRSFIRNLAADADSQVVTTAVIALSRGLHIPVVAEGVETEEHRDLLVTMGCDEAQGYLYSKPVAFDKVITVMRNVEERSAAPAAEARL